MISAVRRILQLNGKKALDYSLAAENTRSLRKEIYHLRQAPVVGPSMILPSVDYLVQTTLEQII
jgi:hypothetical protein